MADYASLFENKAKAAPLPTSPAAPAALMPTGAKHAAIAPDGTTTLLSDAELPLARMQGYTIQTAEQAHEQQLQDTYGTAGGQAKAALLGALSGATMGVSNMLLSATHAVSPETLKGLEEANPTTSTAAEIGGNIAPLLLSGGTGAIAKGVSAIGTPVRMAGLAGEKVAEGLAKQFVKAGVRADSANFLARAAARTLPQAIGSGAEGALYGAAEALNEHALGEPGTIGEKLIANVGLAAMFGAGVGGLAGLATGTVAKHALHGPHTPGSLAHEAAAAEGVSRGTAGEPLITPAPKGEAVAEGLAGEAAESAIPPVADANTVEIPGTPGSTTTPVDPASPEGIRQQAAEFGAAMHATDPAPPRTAPGSIDATLAGAGSHKGMPGGTLNRMIKNVTGTDLFKGVAEKWATISSKFTGGDAETIKAFTSGEGAAELRDLATKSDEHVVREVRGAVDALNQYGKLRRTAQDLTLGDSKFSEAARVIPKGQEAAATQQAVSTFSQVRAQLKALASDATMNQGYIAKASKIVDNYEAKILDFATSPSPHPDVVKHGLGAAVFHELDEFKRAMGHRTFKDLQRSMAPGDSATYRALGDVYTKTLIPSLTDENVWGAMGTRQAAMNKVWNKAISLSGEFDMDFFTKYGKELDGFGRIRRADPAKVEDFFRHLSDPRNDLKAQRFREHLDDIDRFVDEAHKHGIYDEAAQSTATQLKEVVANLRGQMGRVEKTIAARNQLEQLTRGSVAFNMSGAGVAGAMLGGPLGALVGMATSQFISPAKVVRQLAAMDVLVQKTDAAIGKSLDAALGSSLGIGKEVRAGAEASIDGAAHVHRPHAEHAAEHAHGFAHRVEETARRLGDHAVETAHALGHEEARHEAKGHGAASHVAPKGEGYEPGHAHQTTVRHHTEPHTSAPPKLAVKGVTGPLQVVVHAIGDGRFDDEGDSAPKDRSHAKTLPDRLDNFRKAGKAFMRYLSNPTGIMDKLHANTAIMSQVAPETAMAAQMTLAQGVKFLADKMPHPDVSPLPEALQRPFTPSEEDMDRMDRYARVVQDPLSVMTDLAQNKLSYEAMDALKNVYPQIHQAMVHKTMEKLQDWPTVIPYNKKVQLGLLLGAPLDDTMLPANLMLMANNGVPQNAAPPPPPGAQSPAPAPAHARVNTSALQKSRRSNRLETRSQQLEESTP